MYVFLPPSRVLLPRCCVILARPLASISPLTPHRHPSLAVLQDATAFNQNLQTWTVPAGMECTDFATGATAWLDAYPPGVGGTIASTPPLSQSMIDAGCGP